MVELHEGTVLARVIADELPHAYVSVIQPDLTVGFTAGSAFRDRGLDPAAFEGRSVEEVFGPYGPDVLATVRSAYGAALGGQVQRFELDIDGEHQIYVAVPLHNGAGRVTGLVSVVRNVSGQRREADARDQLERQVQQLQRLDSIGRLVSGVAHDFNNMLGVVIGYADLVLSTLPTDHELRPDVREIEGAARRAAALARQLLAVARQQPRVPEVLDLREHLAAMEQFLRRTLGEQVQVHAHSPDDLWPVLFDPSQIDQVIANLAVNSRDAMPDGGDLTIELRNRSFEAPLAAEHAGLPFGDYVQVAVTDTGVGMDAATRDRALEPFFTTKGPDGGNGLGLATVYGIARQNGGHVRIYSEVGEGTTVSVFLPRHAGAARARPRAPEAELPSGSEHVLVVEDDQRLAVVLRRLLERLGYRATVAGTADQARQAMRAAAPIDLLITDMVLPREHGTSLAADLRARIPGLPVIFVSGYAPEAIRSRVAPARGAYFLQKPVELADLAVTVRRALDAEPVF